MRSTTSRRLSGSILFFALAVRFVIPFRIKAE